MDLFSSCSSSPDRVRVCRGEEVECGIPSDCYSLQDDHGPGDEGEVVGDQEGVLEEDSVQVQAHRHELLPPAHNGLVQGAVALHHLLGHGQLICLKIACRHVMFVQIFY